MSMREVALTDRGVAAEVLDALAHTVVMLQMPTVFVLLAPPTAQGVAALNRTKTRLPRKNYGTALGSLANFYRMATRGALPTELDSVEGLSRLSGAFIRMRVAPASFESPLVRGGTHQGLLIDGPYRDLFTQIEAGLAHLSEPALTGGHHFSAPLCTSANISGDPDGSITQWDRAYAFGVDREVPLVVRSGVNSETSGSFPIFWLQHDRIQIPRPGPGVEEIRARLPQRLFGQGLVETGSRN